MKDLLLGVWEIDFLHPRSNGPQGPKDREAAGIYCSVNSTTGIFSWFIAA